MRAGFTLIETLIALAVTALALLTLQFGMQMITVHSQQKYEEQLAWYHMLGELEGEDYRFSLEKITSQKAQLKPHTDKERTYLLKAKKGNFILTTDKGGYMPLLTGVSAHNFSVDHGHLKIEATTKLQRFSAVTAIGEEHE